MDAAPPRPRPRVRVPVARLARLADGEHALGAQVARYLAGARRLRVGDPFVAFDPARGVEADGEVIALPAADLVARLGAVRPAALVATRDVTWVQGLPKGDKMDGIVRDATELGATRIVPAATTFAVVKLDGPRAEARRQRWQRIADEAARQCARSDAPEVLPVQPWADAIGLAESRGAALFCLYERATSPLGPPLTDALALAAPLAFAAGPEGGLSEAEVELVRATGGTVVSLGPFVLRAETVAAATLGAVRVLEGAQSRAPEVAGA